MGSTTSYNIKTGGDIIFLSLHLLYISYFENPMNFGATQFLSSIRGFFSGLKGQLGVPLTVYPWYPLYSLGILGDYNPQIPTNTHYIGLIWAFFFRDFP